MKRRIGSWIVCIVLVAAPVCGWANAGDLDPTFGNNGIVITPIGNSGDNDEIAALVLQPDGKLVAAGYTAHLGVAKYDVAVVRYGADGSLDPTFGNGGKVTTAIGSAFDRAHALVLQPDGKLVAAGSTYNQATNYDFALVRYNSDGSLDATFGSNGKVTTSIAGGADEAFALVLQPDGKLVAAGYANQGATSNDFALARYSASGALDPTFGNGGIVTTPVIRGSDQIYALGLQPDGKLVAAGTGGVARYLAGGGLDDTFGNGGLVAAPINTLARALVLQPDGKLVMAGLYYDPVAGANFRVVRYAANGALDDTFGSGGIANTAFPNANVACRALALMPDGRLVAAGQSGGNFALARYSRNGKPDFTFGAGGKLVTPPYAAAALVLQPDAKLVAAGSSYSGGRLDFGLARYMS